MVVVAAALLGAREAARVQGGTGAAGVDGGASHGGSGSAIGLNQTYCGAGVLGVTDAPTDAISAASRDQQDQTAVALMHEQTMPPTLLPGGIKEFILTAEPVIWHLYLDKNVHAWGYNGQVPGPLIRLRVGDTVRIVLRNRLPVPTTLHLQGLDISPGLQGVPGISQRPAPPGGSAVYQFRVTTDMVGTHAYFSDAQRDLQIDAGLHGVLIVDSASSTAQSPHAVDALFEIGAFKVDASPMENVFTLDGKPAPEAPQLTVHIGDLVRLRLVNNSAECYHAMHLHGGTFWLVDEDGHPLKHPLEMNVISLAPAETADIEFVARNPGTWMFHCHIMDHMMNPDDNVDDMGGLVTYIHIEG